MQVKLKACSSTDRFPHLPARPATLDGSDLEYVDNYKYLGVWLDCKLSFQTHIKHFQSKIKSRIGFLFRKQSILHSCCQTYPCKTDCPTDPWLRRCHLQNSLQHSAQQIGWSLSQCHPFCHQSPIYYPPLRPVGWPSLHIRHQTHWLQVIYMSLLGKAMSYLSSLVTIASPTRSMQHVYLTGHPQSQFLFWPPFLPFLCCQWLEWTAKITKAGDSYLPH